MRSSDDQNQIKNVFLKVFEFPIEVNLLPRIDFLIESKPQLIGLVCNICVGVENLSYNYSGLKLSSFPHHFRTVDTNKIDSPLRGSLQKYVEIISSCINHSWPILLVGS